MHTVACVVAMSLSGCSLLTMPKPQPARPPACNPSRARPAGDVVLGTMLLVPTILTTLFAMDHTSCGADGECEQVEGRGDLVLPALGFVALNVTAFVSAGVGFSRARQCRMAREAAASG